VRCAVRGGAAERIVDWRRGLRNDGGTRWRVRDAVLRGSVHSAQWPIHCDGSGASAAQCACMAVMRGALGNGDLALMRRQ